jgi:5-methylcytosine-specific restriction protein A
VSSRAPLAKLSARVQTVSLAITGIGPSAPQGHDAMRGTSASRGYGYAWQQARRGFLDKHPLCVHCKAEGRVEPANEVDHIIPHRGNKVLFWDRLNWQALCKPHHSAKTARGE